MRSEIKEHQIVLTFCVGGFEQSMGREPKGRRFPGDPALDRFVRRNGK